MKIPRNAANWCPSPYLSRLGAFAVPFLAASAAGAQFVEPPTITTTTVERTVHGDVGADGEDCLHDFDETSSGEDGPFAWPASVQCTGMYGSGGLGTTQQDTYVSNYSISGSGSISANATVGNDPNAWVTLNVWSQLSVQFTVPVDTVMQLDGNFEITVGEDPDGTCGEDTGGWVFFTGTDTNGAPILFNQTFDCEDPPEQASFFHPDTLKANTPAHLFIWVASGVMGVVGGESPDLGQRSASFDFKFDLGDRDGDGLLNIWEEQEGINVDGDSDLEVDLPGADPDKKDLYVEVDVMSGVVIDETAFSLVTEAFAEAPGWMVRNPDGSNGINLHVIWNDGDAPPKQPLVDPLVGDPSPFQTIKNDYFGSVSDRNSGNWDQIREARLRVFRYCIVTEDLVRNGESRSGVAESPGDDFVVGTAALTHSEQATKGLAGFFMHELGHNLDLGHGGEDDENFKPNYLSVMNYAYVVPWLISDPQGNNFADYWRLDYSRKELRTLDEFSLIESEGLDGPQGRLIVFNSSDSSPLVKTLAWANSSEIDWNNNGSIDPDPVQVAISHQTSDENISLDMLDSYSDWDRLWYHLPTSTSSGDGTAYHSNSISTGIALSVIEDFISGDWVDQTALGDLIFENGFELGSTTAWSDTVP